MSILLGLLPALPPEPQLMISSPPPFNEGGIWNNDEGRMEASRERGREGKRAFLAHIPSY